MAKKKADNTELLKDLVIDAILEKKGQDVISLDLREIHDTVADYFIIAHGDSNTQVNAIFQSVLETTKNAGQLPYHSEGQKNGEWVIVDYVDVVAHIFYRERRDFYQLEELWSDAKVTKHDPAGAIKPKAIRQPNRKWVVSEDTLEDIERALPKHERAPVVADNFKGRPFAKRNAERRAVKQDERRAADKTPTEKKTATKKTPDTKAFASGKALAKKGPAKKSFAADKAPAKRASAASKAPAKKAAASKAPAGKAVASKAPVSKKTVTTKTSTKKK